MHICKIQNSNFYFLFFRMLASVWWCHLPKTHLVTSSSKLVARLQKHGSRWGKTNCNTCHASSLERILCWWRCWRKHDCLGGGSASTKCWQLYDQKYNKRLLFSCLCAPWLWLWQGKAICVTFKIYTIHTNVLSSDKWSQTLQLHILLSVNFVSVFNFKSSSSPFLLWLQ